MRRPPEDEDGDFIPDDDRPTQAEMIPPTPAELEVRTPGRRVVDLMAALEASLRPNEGGPDGTGR